MQDVCSKCIRASFLAPAYNGAQLMNRWQLLIMARKAGKGSVFVWTHLHRQSEQRHVIINGISIVPWVCHHLLYLQPRNITNAIFKRSVFLIVHETLEFVALYPCQTLPIVSRAYVFYVISGVG
jgi:hypothetical protein